MKIVVDVMGGDNAPKAPIEGALMALDEFSDLEVILIGEEVSISKILKEKKYPKNRVETIFSTEVITNDDKPVKAIRSKKNSSMVLGLNFVKEKKADAIVSAGNTGALLSGGLFILGRIKEIDRPALCSYMPHTTGLSLLVDAGANADCKPINLLQFALMAEIYSKKVLEIKTPRVKMLNIGIEEGKGNELAKKSFELLKSQTIFNFEGNIEAREVTMNSADVIVADGFTANMVLKATEGSAMTIMGLLKNSYKKSLLGKLSAFLIKEDLKKMKKILDYREYGGAPLLGVNGGLIKAHGSSDSKAIKNAIKQAYLFSKNDIVKEIESNIYKLNKEENS